MDLAQRPTANITTLELLRGRLAAPLRQVEDRMRAVMMTGDPLVQRLFGATGHPGGKRIRPIIVLLTAEAFGVTGDKTVSVATATELTHMATLLHDDVIDNAKLRRGQPTLHSIWGNKLAVLGGDFLFARAFGLLVEAGDLRLLGSMSDMIAGMGEGEIMQVFHAYDLSTGENDYFERIRRKTAWFMATCAELGSFLGSASDTQSKAMYDYGMNIGMAFQVMDDILDLTGDQETVGKTVGSDLLEGNFTLPVLHALKGSRGDQIRGILGKKKRLEAEKAAQVAEIVKSEGSLEYAYSVAQQFVRAAQRELRVLPSNEAVACLFDLADYMISRDW